MFDQPVRPEHVRQLVQQAFADVRVSHFTAAERDRHLDLIAAVQKLRGLPSFGRQIMIVDFRSNSDFLELNDMLVAPRFPFLTALLVPELPVVHQSADRRDRVGRHLDEIQASLARHVKRLTSLHDSDLRAFLVNQPDFANANALIHASLNWSCYVVPP